MDDEHLSEREADANTNAAYWAVLAATYTEQECEAIWYDTLVLFNNFGMDADEPWKLTEP